MSRVKKKLRNTKHETRNAAVRTIGLLGGSFNPAHEGHLHISLYALHKLGLDEVWWLVSPQNPLKFKATLAAYQQRLSSARAMAKHPRIRVLDIERRRGWRYSWQTVAGLKQRHKSVQFLWLMGADNLAGFHRWRRWKSLFLSIPVVVFDRIPYNLTALKSPAGLYFQRFLVGSQAFDPLKPAPWLYFARMARHPVSSTAIRKNLENTQK